MRAFAETLAWPEERGFAIDAAVSDRIGFLRRTYSHLLMELCAVAAVTSLALRIPFLVRNTLPIMLVGFLGILFVVPKLLTRGASRGQQYGAAALMVAFYGVLLAPLAWVVHAKTGSFALLGQAFVITACVFAGLTAYVFTTRKDFSAWGGFLHMALWGAIGLGILSMFFGGFAGSNLYSILIVVLFSGFVLYDTSKILHRHHVDEHVPASIALMIDFVVLFQHVALILLRSRD